MQIFIITSKQGSNTASRLEYILSGASVNGEVSGIAIEHTGNGGYDKYYIYRNVVFPVQEGGTVLTEDQQLAFFRRFAGEEFTRSAQTHLDEYVSMGMDSKYAITEDKIELFPPDLYRSSEDIFPVSLRHHFWESGYGVPSIKSLAHRTIEDIETHFAD